MRRLIAILALVLALPAWAQSPPAFTTPLERDHALVGRIWLPAEGRFAEIDEIVARARAADALLLGETHDNADHHALQAWMLKQVGPGGRPPLVAFEMFDASQREKLDKHLAENPLDAAGLGPAVAWDKSGWPAWDNYRPIAEAALRGGSALAPANLARADMRAVAKGEVPAQLEQLGLGRPLDPAINRAMEAEIKTSHCDMLPEASVPAMVRVQRARDAIMARTLADGMATQGRAVLIAGAGHIRTDRGVPTHLAKMAPGRKVLALAFVEVGPGKGTPATYGELFDVASPPFDAVWFTPRAQREDQCALLKKHLDKK